MKLASLYLPLAFLGILFPYYHLFTFLSRHGLDLKLAGQQLVATPISSFFGVDVIISAVVLLCFIRSETRQQPVPGAWASVIGTLVVGVSFGLPIFLFLRERQRLLRSAGR